MNHEIIIYTVGIDSKLWFWYINIPYTPIYIEKTEWTESDRETKEGGKKQQHRITVMNISRIDRNSGDSSFHLSCNEEHFLRMKINWKYAET